MNRSDKPFSIGLVLLVSSLALIAATPIKNLLLQSDMDAGGHTILNLGASTNSSSAVTRGSLAPVAFTGNYASLTNQPLALQSLGMIIGTNGNFLRFGTSNSITQRTPAQVRSDIGATTLAAVADNLGNDPYSFFADVTPGVAAFQIADFLDAEDGRWAHASNPYFSGTMSGNFVRSGTTTGGTYVSPAITGTMSVSGTNSLVVHHGTPNVDPIRLIGPYGGGLSIGRDDGYNVVIAANGTDRNLVLFPSGGGSTVDILNPRLNGSVAIEGDAIATGRMSLNAQPSFPSSTDALAPENFYKYYFGLAMVNAVDVPPSQGVSLVSGSGIVGGNGAGYGYVRLDTGATADSVAAKYFWHHRRNTGNGQIFTDYTGIITKVGLGYGVGSRFKVALGKANSNDIDWGNLSTDGVAVEWECVTSGSSYRWRLIRRLGGSVTVGSWTTVSNDGQCQMALFGNGGNITFAYRSWLGTGAWTIAATESIAGLVVANDTGIWIGYSNVDATWSAAQIDKIFMIYGINPL